VLRQFQVNQILVEVQYAGGVYEVLRNPGVIVSRNEEFMIAAVLMCEAVVLWEISRTPMVFFCHWTVGNFVASPKGGRLYVFS
jgi:hypothetical protein